MKMNTTIHEIAYIRLYELLRGRSIWEKVLRLMRQQWLTKHEIQQIQFRKLKKIILHAYNEVPYYREKFDQAGFDPSSFECVSQITEIPILTKNEFQDNYNKMLSANYIHYDGHWDSTGGSTGGPSWFFVGRPAGESIVARDIRFRKWFGFNIGDRKAKLWGAERDIATGSLIRSIAKMIFYNVLELNSWTMSTRMMKAYIQRIRNFKPSLIEAYARALFLLSKFAIENDMTQGLDMTAVISAESIDEMERDTVESVFGTQVFNRYGSREFGNIAQECNKHNGMHIAAESLVVEEIDTGPNPHPLLITDLERYSMPLIRYECGDCGEIIRSRCQCGRNLPRIVDLSGRITDFITTPQGQIVNGTVFAHFLRHIRSIREYQIIQDEINHIIVRVVTASPLQKSGRNRINSSISSFLGENMDIEICRVERIERPPSGKFLTVKSSITDYESILNARENNLDDT